MADASASLLANLEAFTSFAQSQLGDIELARDAVQESLLKAMSAEQQPVETDAVRWFYPILRRTIIDLHRRRGSRKRMLARYEGDHNTAAGPEEERLLCACFERLLPQLPPQYEELLRRVDRRGAAPLRSRLNAARHRTR